MICQQPPEIRDAGGGVGIAEVFREVETKHPAEADRHIGIAGKIEIDLEGERRKADPGGENRKLSGLQPRNRLPDLPCRVREQHLFGQAHGKAADARSKVGKGLLPVLQLAGYGLHSDDRPGDELGEQGNIGAEIENAALHLHLSPVQIDDVGEGLEGIKRYADRQRHLQQREPRPGHAVNRTDKEIRVFEEARAGAG